jgi:hypothetical protein
VSRIVSVLCLVVCGCATAVEKPPPGTPKIKAKWVAVVTDRLTTIRGSFSLPPGCRAECRFHYDEWSAVMSCPELQGSLRYWSGLYAPPQAIGVGPAHHVQLFAPWYARPLWTSPREFLAIRGARTRTMWICRTRYFRCCGASAFHRWTPFPRVASLLSQQRRSIEPGASRPTRG